MKKFDLSPIILFTFNRPDHTKRTLAALSLNKEAKESLLYIYCDGPKVHHTSHQLDAIKKVRDISRSENRFLKVFVVENNVNKGLAKSIIAGVSEVIARHGKVIVVEDDIVVSKGFLDYMNGALQMYNQNEKVGCIHGWNYELDNSEYYEATFFLKGADCWGWATWKRAWNLFEPDGASLFKQIKDAKSEFEFNRHDTHDFMNMLDQQIKGLNDSWAIRWHASLFLKDKYCLQPTRSIVKNIGLDNSGTHCGISNIIQNPVERINLVSIPVEETDWFFTAFDSFQKKDKHGNKIMAKVKDFIKTLIPPIVISTLQFFRKVDLSSELRWSGDFKSWADAKAECTGYDTNLILEQCKKSMLKIKSGEAVYERDSVLFNEIQYNWVLLATLLKITLGNQGSLKVLDFGGSLGSSYFQNKQFLEGASDLKWGIVEQSHFVDCGKEHFENDNLKFFYSLEDCFNDIKPDVALFSSVLQYIENPYGLIDHLLTFKIPYLIIDRTAFIEASTELLTVQNVPERIYKASYPAWFFNKEKFINHFLSHYDLVFEANVIIDAAEYIGEHFTFRKALIFKLK